MRAANRKSAVRMMLQALVVGGYLVGMVAAAPAQLPFEPPPVGGAYGEGPAPANPALADPALVGPRYATQPQPSPQYPQPRAAERIAPPSSAPSGPIQYPVADTPTGQVLAEAEFNEECKVFARVGSQIVLGGDFLRQVDGIMEANRERIDPATWETQRLVLIKEVLDKVIETKLVLADAYRKIPEENLPNLEQQVNDQFEETQLKKMLADTGCASRGELDQLLRRQGSSLDQQRRMFLERAVTSQWIRQSIDTDPEVTHDQMWRYYQAHLDDYRQPPKTRWQELHVAFDQHESRDQAYRKIAQMGNDVLRGVPFEKVAAAHSNGLTAREGGAQDWTSRGSLRSEQLDELLFTLPPERLSSIVTEPDGFYIIRVVERQDETVTPFRDAQVEIAEILRKEDREAQVDAYYAELRRDIPVWTIFDDPSVAAKLPPERR